MTTFCIPVTVRNHEVIVEFATYDPYNPLQPEFTVRYKAAGQDWRTVGTELEHIEIGLAKAAAEAETYFISMGW